MEEQPMEIIYSIAKKCNYVDREALSMTCRAMNAFIVSVFGVGPTDEDIIKLFTKREFRLLHRIYWIRHTKPECVHPNCTMRPIALVYYGYVCNLHNRLMEGLICGLCGMIPDGLSGSFNNKHRVLLCKYCDRYLIKYGV